MRTTIDLPDDLHTLARELAHQQNKSLSQVVVELIRSATGDTDGPRVERSPSGRLVVHLGYPITEEDVKSLEDEW